MEEKSVLKSYIEQIREDKVKKVLFIGDSVMYSSASESDQETISAYVSHKIKAMYPNEDIHFYNLGVKGLSIGDAYYLLKLLYDEDNLFELIIYDVNIGWFNDKLINRELILQLYPKDSLDWDKLSLTPTKLGVEEWLNQNVMKYWQFYHYRYLISDMFFGKPVPQAIRDQAEAIFNPQGSKVDEIYIPWYEKDWDKQFEGDWKIGKISYENQQWNYFVQLMDLID